MAATNFTGQNLGAGKYDRIRQGTYACLLLGIIYCAIYIVIARFGTQYLVLLFMNADEAQSVLDYTQRISYAYAYGTPLLLGVNVFRLSIQGMGYSRLSLISGLLEMIARTAVGIWGVPQFGFAAGLPGKSAGVGAGRLFPDPGLLWLSERPPPPGGPRPPGAAERMRARVPAVRHGQPGPFAFCTNPCSAACITGRSMVR